MEAVERQKLMRLLGAVIGAAAAALLAGCAMPADEPEIVASNAQVAEPPASTDAPVTPPAPIPQPELVIEQPPARAALSCSGSATQGGLLLCRTAPGASLLLNGKAVAVADADGVAAIGLARNQTSPVRISIAASSADAANEPASVEIAVGSRTDTVARFPMDCDKIQAQTPAQKRHAEVSWVKKDKALKEFHAPLAPYGLIKPAEGPYSSPFGATRTYQPRTPDCEGSTSVHNGQDIAIATGTPILAPMTGTVLLADPDLYYEGGAVFLDLGHGLVSVTMHMSRVDVAAGDVVKQGATLGLSGATGRVTGPHLHWAIKYRNVHETDRGTDIWLDPVLLMQASLDTSDPN